jgi:hypothetical protein
MNEPRSQWVGWVWQRGRWHRVCQAETLAACSRQLGEQARRLGVRDWHTMMTGGNVPVVMPARPHRIAQDAADGYEAARVGRPGGDEGR